MLDPDVPTFEINGHEASVFYHNDDIHIFSTNRHILPNLLEYLDIYYPTVRNLVFFVPQILRQMVHPDVPTSEISGHKASV